MTQEPVVYKQLDKYRADVEKLEKKYSDIGKKLDEARKVLQDAERDQFMADLNSRGITPEQLVMILNAANAGGLLGITGELAGMLAGQKNSAANSTGSAPWANRVTSGAATKETDVTDTESINNDVEDEDDEI